MPPFFGMWFVYPQFQRQTSIVLYQNFLYTDWYMSRHIILLRLKRKIQTIWTQAVPQEILFFLEESEDIRSWTAMELCGHKWRSQSCGDTPGRPQGESFTMEFRMESQWEIQSVVALLKPLTFSWSQMALDFLVLCQQTSFLLKQVCGFW